MDERVDRLRAYLPEYLRERGIRRLRRHFRCLSPHHEDKHPSMSYYEKGQCVKCFSCGFTADIFDLYAQDHGLSVRADFVRIITELSEKYQVGAVTSNSVSQGRKSAPPHSSYWEKRGILPETAAHFGAREHTAYLMGDRKIGPCVTIPYGPESDYIIAREIEEKRYWKPAGREEPLFWPDVLDGEESVVIVESAICAMSLYQVGYHAIACNGTGVQRLADTLIARKTLPPLILCFD